MANIRFAGCIFPISPRLLRESLLNVSLHTLINLIFSQPASQLTVHTIVLSVHNALVRSIDDSKVSMLVLLDLSAAFDTVDHDILLSILTKHFGIRDTAYDWFSSYLSLFTQSFSFDGQQTGLFSVDCSVPQRSVLGQLKFIAYTENGVETIKHHEVNLHMYADDTQLHNCCYPQNTADMRCRMSCCTADFSEWCASHRLPLNADKTEVMWIGSKHGDSSLVRRVTGPKGH